MMNRITYSRSMFKNAIKHYVKGIEEEDRVKINVTDDQIDELIEQFYEVIECFIDYSCTIEEVDE